MDIRGRLIEGGRYIWARLGEASFWKGFILVAATVSWHDMDHTSRGELLAQAGLFAYGFINAVLPDSVLYGARTK